MDKSTWEKPKVKTPDSLRAGAGQAATRLLRSATALQVTPPQRCGSRRWYGRKVPFGPKPQPPLSLVNSVPLRIGPDRSRARNGEADP